MRCCKWIILPSDRATVVFSSCISPFFKNFFIVWEYGINLLYLLARKQISIKYISIFQKANYSICCLLNFTGLLLLFFGQRRSSICLILGWRREIGFPTIILWAWWGIHSLGLTLSPSEHRHTAGKCYSLLLVFTGLIFHCFFNWVSV